MSDLSEIYPETGNAVPNAVTRWLQNPPPWRTLDAVPEHLWADERPDQERIRWRKRGTDYVSAGHREVLAVNVSLMLRRPLLVKGKAGIGKSTLAYRIAVALGLGEPLRWEINSQSTLKDGLYRYDAVSHLRAIQQAKKGETISVDRFIQLGPLGTALLPTKNPRVLLIDEIDKASFDLPNDLLHVFEEGSFVIDELKGEKAEPHHRVVPHDVRGPDDSVPVALDARVQTRHHPVVVMTSNGERTFPEAFMRRCVELELVATPEHMRKIVSKQLGDVDSTVLEADLKRYGDLATDVLLQALFLQSSFSQDGGEIEKILAKGRTKK